MSINHNCDHKIYKHHEVCSRCKKGYEKTYEKTCGRTCKKTCKSRYVKKHCKHHCRHLYRKIPSENNQYPIQMSCIISPDPINISKDIDTLLSFTFIVQNISEHVVSYNYPKIFVSLTDKLELVIPLDQCNLEPKESRRFIYEHIFAAGSLEQELLISLDTIMVGSFIGCSARGSLDRNILHKSVNNSTDSLVESNYNIKKVAMTSRRRSNVHHTNAESKQDFTLAFDFVPDHTTYQSNTLYCKSKSLNGTNVLSFTNTSSDSVGRFIVDPINGTCSIRIINVGHDFSTSDNIYVLWQACPVTSTDNGSLFQNFVSDVDVTVYDGHGNIDDGAIYINGTSIQQVGLPSYKGYPVSPANVLKHSGGYIQYTFSLIGTDGNVVKPITIGEMNIMNYNIDGNGNPNLTSTQVYNATHGKTSQGPLRWTVVVFGSSKKYDRTFDINVSLKMNTVALISNTRSFVPSKYDIIASGKTMITGNAPDDSTYSSIGLLDGAYSFNAISDTENIVHTAQYNVNGSLPISYSSQT